MNPETRAALSFRSRLCWPVLGAALLTAVYMIVVLCCMRVQYVGNDDVTIMDYARQGFQVRYTGIVLTELLHLGYVWAPSIAWYGVVLYALDALSLFLWLALLFGLTRPWWLAALFVPALLGFYLRYVAFLNYTAVSVMLCSVAVTWALVAVLERRTSYGSFLWPGMILMLGMLVRPHGVPGTLIFTLPLSMTAILVTLSGQSWKNGSSHLAWAALLFLLPAGANVAVDSVWRAATTTPAETRYVDFNSPRGQVHRLNRERKRALLRNRTALAAAHLRKVDVSRLYNWNFLDERIYTPEAMRILLRYAPPPRVSAKAFFHNAWRRAKWPFMTLVLGCLPLLLLAWRGHGAVLLPALALPPYYLLLMATMSVLFIFPIRVQYPLSTALGLCTFVFASQLARPKDGDRQAPYRWAVCLAAAVAFVGAYITVRGEMGHYKNYGLREQALQTTLRVLNTDYAGKVILIAPQWGLPLEMLDPLRPIDLRFQPVQLGWSTFSPRFYKQIGALGVRHGYELVDAFIDRDDAYLLGKDHWPPTLYNYASDKGPCGLEIETARKFPGKVLLFRLHRKRGCPGK
jgi:hypothetical protein